MCNYLEELDIAVLGPYSSDSGWDAGARPFHSPVAKGKRLSYGPEPHSPSTESCRVRDPQRFN